MKSVTVTENTKRCGGNTRSFIAIPKSKEYPNVPIGVPAKVFFEKRDSTLEIRYVFDLNDIPPI